MERRNRRALLATSAIIVLGVIAYLIASRLKYGLGFPLDDAWIHQTYARNLGQNGEWAFLPGQKSAGSTGPMWSGLLSLGYVFGIHYTVWTYLVGSLMLLAIVYIAGAWFTLRVPERTNWRWVVMCVVGLEWHLLWSALSGMETIAIALVNVAVLYALERQDHTYLGIGLLIGVGFWLRPEALLLLLPVAWVVMGDMHVPIQKRIYQLGGVVGLFLLVVIPYLIMNHFLVGSIWPTTFFAKQAEYAFLRQQSLLLRLFRQVAYPLAGVGFVLLPGMILEAVRSIRQRNWKLLTPLVWATAFFGTYALRLPVYYQHGRYAMPVIPILLVVGCAGMSRWLELTAENTARRIGARVSAAVLIVVTLAFLGIGANAYATDVAIIETEMVAASHWIRENTPPEALIAAHDIGALGYFGERQILDLAGLISPEVIPILWNEPALTDLLNNRGANYLMTFPGWYPGMTEGLPVVFDSQGIYSPSIGGENMTVYTWLGE